MYTNADRITEDVESLAKELIEPRCSHCAYNGTEKCVTNPCIEGIEAWLNQPAVCESKPGKLPYEEQEPDADYRQKAGKAYLEQHGYEIVEEFWNDEYQTINVAAIDRGDDKGKTLALIFVHVAENGLGEKFFTREEHERDMVAFMAAHGDKFEDMHLRFDTITINLLSNSRALIKHHVNVANKE